MKKEVLAAIAAALAVWFFVMGFEIGVYKERRDNAKAMASAGQPVVSTQPYQQEGNVTAPTTLPTLPGNDVTVAPTEAPITAAPGKEINNLSTDEIVGAVSNAVNTLKQTPNFTAVRTLNVVVRVVDCSVPAAVEKINEIITDVTSQADTCFRRRCCYKLKGRAGYCRHRSSTRKSKLHSYRCRCYISKS